MGVHFDHLRPLKAFLDNSSGHFQVHSFLSLGGLAFPDRLLYAMIASAVAWNGAVDWNGGSRGMPLLEESGCTS